MLRRLLALGVALVVLILVVLGVKGCLDSRARGALSSYAGDVEQIVNETSQTSKAFFGKLEDPGNLSVPEFTGAVDADRSAMDTLLGRVEALSAPGEMSSAQKSLEIVYELRDAAMGTIAAKMNTALGEAGAQQATAAIARQMQKLLASDVTYESITRPEIDGKLADNGIEDHDVPKSTFVPDGTWRRSAGRPPARLPKGPTGSGWSEYGSGKTNWSRKCRTPWWSKARPKSKSKSKTRANRRRTGSPWW
jgi:hypothetical protein